MKQWKDVTWAKEKNNKILERTRLMEHFLVGRTSAVELLPSAVVNSQQTLLSLVC